MNKATNTACSRFHAPAGPRASARACEVRCFIRGFPLQWIYLYKVFPFPKVFPHIWDFTLKGISLSSGFPTPQGGSLGRRSPGARALRAASRIEGGDFDCSTAEVESLDLEFVESSKFVSSFANVRIQGSSVLRSCGLRLQVFLEAS